MGMEFGGRSELGRPGETKKNGVDETRERRLAPLREFRASSATLPGLDGVASWRGDLRKIEGIENAGYGGLEATRLTAGTKISKLEPFDPAINELLKSGRYYEPAFQASLKDVTEKIGAANFKLTIGGQAADGWAVAVGENKFILHTSENQPWGAARDSMTATAKQNWSVIANRLDACQQLVSLMAFA